MKQNILSIAALCIGVALLIISIIYFKDPANSLPTFFPGYDAMLTKHHYKHGIGTFLLALACFAYVWFQTGDKKK